MIKVKYVGIDGWNRAVFKEKREDEKKFYFGRTFGLFDYGVTEQEVLKEVEDDELVYFGRSFGCEPNGTPKEVKIIK